MILSGEIHYARVPRSLWRDRLLKLVRAGFNTVSTYFFWNFHEISPGVFDFSGDKDVDEFLSLASSLGLNIIARVGPYACAEWDNGGHPDWLLRDNLVARSLDKSYFPYAEKWLRIILSKISAHDPSRGGRLVGLQLENEYFWGDMPYHIELAKIARGLGVTVDLYTNANRYARNTLFIDSVDLYPDPWRLDDVINALKDLSETQPRYRPKIMEYEGGWFSKITKPLPTERGSFPSKWSRMLLATALAYGADLINIYMFHGGTNFGYWAARWMTTTYDYEAAIREWGELSDRYYKFKSLTQLAYLVSDTDLVSEERMGNRIRIIRGRGDTKFIFYINNTDEPWIEGGVKVPARDVRVVAQDLRLGSLEITSNLDILAVRGDTVIFYGDAGDEINIVFRGEVVRSCYGVSVDNNVISGRVNEVSGCLIEARDGVKRVLIVDRVFAERTWFIDYPIISNIYFVEDADSSRIIAHLREGRNIIYVPLRTGEYIPELGLGRIVVDIDAPEPVFEILGIEKEDLGLTEIGFYKDPPKPEDIGLYQHDIYVYETEIPRRSYAGLAFHDYGVVFSGDMISSGIIWWEGYLDQGIVKIFVDSTGHSNDPDWSFVPQKTGLVTPILIDKIDEKPLLDWEYAVLDLGRRFQPGVASFNSHSYLINRDIPYMLREIRIWDKSIPKINTQLAILYMRTKIFSNARRHAVIKLRDIDRTIVVILNRSVVYKGKGNDIFDTQIHAELMEGENELVLGAPYYDVRGELKPPFKEVSYSTWRGVVEGYKIYRISRRGGEVSRTREQPVNIDKPSVVTIRFRVVKRSEISPIYAEISGDVIAQIYLNNIFIGKYYDKGSQKRFYLPEPYLSNDTNELRLITIPTTMSSKLNISFGAYYTARRVEIKL